MSVKFYMDHNMHGDLITGIRLRGIACITALEDGTADIDDELILERATSLGCVLVTTDEDLLAITAKWLQEGRRFAGLIYGHQRRITVGKTIEDLELIFGACTGSELVNTIYHLPL